MLEKEDNSPLSQSLRKEITQKHNLDIYQITSSEEGTRLLRDLSGEQISAISIVRLKDKDLIVLNTANGKVAVVVGHKDSFIAIELKDDKSQSSNLAFRGDISHKRISLVSSVAAGKDVTYQDDSLVTGETVNLNPSARLSQLILEKQAVIEAISPTWWTEDWLTVTLNDGRRIVIRSDRNNLLGVAIATSDKTKIVNIGENRIQDVDFSSDLQDVPNLRFLNE